MSGIYIKGGSYRQGLFGFVSYGTVKNLGVKDSYIAGSKIAGGIAGEIENGTIINCYNTGNISSSFGAGGVAGITNSGDIQNCYNTGSVSGSFAAGGVTGASLECTIQNCYNTGSVSGSFAAGGVTGVSLECIIQNCYNTGSVIGYEGVSVIGFEGVGGIVGYNAGTIQYCYNAGSVSGTSNVGGVAGNNQGTVTGCYYDRQLCPVGGISGDDVEGSVEGRLTSEMASGTALSGWNSSEWNFTEGLYPRLTGYVSESTDYNMDETDAAYVSSSPLFLAETDTSAAVKSNFTVSTANSVTWTSSETGKVSIAGSNATVKGVGSVILTATRGGISKSVMLTVTDVPPQSSGGSTSRKSGTSEKTITVTETSREVFKNAPGSIIAEANMKNALMKYNKYFWDSKPVGWNRLKILSGIFMGWKQTMPRFRWKLWRVHPEVSSRLLAGPVIKFRQERL